MAKASDNEFPSVLFAEQAAAPATPGAGLWRVYFKADGLYIVDDAGTEVGPLGTGGTGSTGDASWTAPSLVNSWVNYGGAYSTAAYRKDGQGFVHLRGTIKGGVSASTAFTLPAGYRPAASLLFAAGTSTTSAPARVDVTVAGAVEIRGVANTSAAMGLDGISFYAEA